MLPEKALSGPSDAAPPEKPPTCEAIPYLARGFPLCLVDSPCEQNSDKELDQLAGVPETRVGPNKFCEQIYTYIKQISIFSPYDFSLYSDFTTFSACVSIQAREVSHFSSTKFREAGKHWNNSSSGVLSSVLRHVSVIVFFLFFKILLRDYLCDYQQSVTTESVFLGDLFKKCVPYIFW